MQYCDSLANKHSSLSIPSRGTVQAFSGRRCGSCLAGAAPFGLQCLNSVACLPPTMPSADFSTVFSVLAAIFIFAMTTYQLGIFAIFGGFMMGVLLHDEHAFVTTWRKRIGPFVMAFFLPIFLPIPACAPTSAGWIAPARGAGVC